MWTLFDPRTESGIETGRATTEGGLSANEDKGGAPSTAEQILFLTDSTRGFDGGVSSCRTMMH